MTAFLRRLLVVAWVGVVLWSAFMLIVTWPHPNESVVLFIVVPVVGLLVAQYLFTGSANPLRLLKSS